MTGFGAVSLWNRLRSTYWFLPSLVTLAAVALGQLLTSIDQAADQSNSWLTWAYGGGADGARALLSAIAASMVTVVSVTFSVLVVALTVSSQHFGPRLLNSFMRDTASQLVLGMFTGTFVYCLVVLRTVRGDGGEAYTSFVPHVAVTGAVLLTLISVAVLIYYVHHVALSMQVSQITTRVANELEAAIDRVYPEPIGDAAPAHEDAPPVPAGATVVGAAESGYVQEIDGETLLALASSHATTIWILARPGDFVIERAPLAAAAPVPKNAGEFEAALQRAFVFGLDRTSGQDAGFAAQQLVEVALRALSPGVNEPFTAMTCLDRLGQGLAKLAARQLPSAVRVGPDGTVRVVAPPRRFDDLLQEVFEPIIFSAPLNTPAVLERATSVLGTLASRSRRVEDRQAIARLGEQIRAKARRLPEPGWSRISRALEDLTEIARPSARSSPEVEPALDAVARAK